MSKIKSSYHSPACIKLQYIPIMLFKKKMNLKLSSNKLAFSVLYFSHTGTNTVYQCSEMSIQGMQPSDTSCSLELVV